MPQAREWSRTVEELQVAKGQRKPWERERLRVDFAALGLCCFSLLPVAVGFRLLPTRSSPFRL